MTDVQASPRWTLIASILGLSVTILDETVVVIALPAMERDLGFGLSGQQWVVNAYLLPLAALLLFGGSLADRYGRRRLFLIGPDVCRLIFAGETRGPARCGGGSCM